MTSPVRAAKGQGTTANRHNPPVANWVAPHIARACAPRICPCVCDTFAGRSSGLPLRRGATLGNLNPRRRLAAVPCPLVALLPARHLATARLPCGVQVEITFAGVADVSRPFAPRPTRCAVCSSSMARCYVCHRRRPYKRVWATFDVAHIAGRNITFVGSLGRSILAGGGLSSLPACAPSPLAARNLPPAPSAPAARRMAECANARPSVRASDTAASYSVAALVARTHPRFPIAAAPSSRAFPLAGVRASCGRARPATLSLSRVRNSLRSPARHAAAEPVNFHRSGVAGGLAQTARGPPSAPAGCNLPPVVSASRIFKNLVLQIIVRLANANRVVLLRIACNSQYQPAGRYRRIIHE